MLTIIIGIIIPFLVTIIVLSMQEKKFHLATLLAGVIPALIGGVVSLAVTAIMTQCVPHSAEASSDTYELAESRFENTSCYVSSHIDNSCVHYNITYIDEDGSLKHEDLDAKNVMFTYRAERPHVKIRAMTVPESWKPWIIPESTYIYEIQLNSLSDIKYSKE